MNLPSCLFTAAVVLATAFAGPARAHDPNEAFDRLPPAAASRAAPTTCEELATRGYSSYDESDDTKALRKRCADEKKAKTPPAPVKKP
jgi:hypothetical protein